MTYNEYMQQIGMKIGMEKGRQEGMKKGMEKARYEIAIEGLNLGIDSETVAKATHLSLTIVNKLKADLAKSR